MNVMTGTCLAIVAGALCVPFAATALVALASRRDRAAWQPAPHRLIDKMAWRVLGFRVEGQPQLNREMAKTAAGPPPIDR